MMKIYPKEARKERTFIITGKKYHGNKMTKVLIETIDYSEDGDIIPHYDGCDIWYSVQKYDNVRMPIGRRDFGGDKEKALKYFNNNNF